MAAKHRRPVGRSPSRAAAAPASAVRRRGWTLLQFLGLVFVLGVLFAGVWLLAGSGGDGERLVLFGFLPEYRLDAADVPRLAQRVSHLALFSLEIDASSGELVPAERFSDERLRSVRRLTRDAGAQLIVAVGGAGRSHGFAALSVERRRQRFVADACRLVDRHGVDGFELNWQWPRSLADVQLWGQLAAELRRACAANVTLSMALPPSGDFAASVADIARHFDLLHWMAYLDPAMADLSRAEAELRRAVHVLPAGKLTLGLPFYGTRASGEHLSYEQILSLPAAADVAYESPSQLMKKVELAKAMRLAGVSVWELGQDCRPQPVGVHPQTCRQEQSLLDQLYHVI